MSFSKMFHEALVTSKISTGERTPFLSVVQRALCMFLLLYVCMPGAVTVAVFAAELRVAARVFEKDVLRFINLTT